MEAWGHWLINWNRRSLRKKKKLRGNHAYLDSAETEKQRYMTYFSKVSQTMVTIFWVSASSTEDSPNDWQLRTGYCTNLFPLTNAANLVSENTRLRNWSSVLWKEIGRKCSHLLIPPVGLIARCETRQIQKNKWLATISYFSLNERTNKWIFGRGPLYCYLNLDDNSHLNLLPWKS